MPLDQLNTHDEGGGFWSSIFTMPERLGHDLKSRSWFPGTVMDRILEEVGLFIGWTAITGPPTFVITEPLALVRGWRWVRNGNRVFWLSPMSYRAFVPKLLFAVGVSHTIELLTEKRAFDENGNITVDFGITLIYTVTTGYVLYREVAHLYHLTVIHPIEVLVNASAQGPSGWEEFLQAASNVRSDLQRNPPALVVRTPVEQAEIDELERLLRPRVRNPRLTLAETNRKTILLHKYFPSAYQGPNLGPTPDLLQQRIFQQTPLPPHEIERLVNISLEAFPPYGGPPQFHAQTIPHLEQVAAAREIRIRQLAREVRQRMLPVLGQFNAAPNDAARMTLIRPLSFFEKVQLVSAMTPPERRLFQQIETYLEREVVLVAAERVRLAAELGDFFRITGISQAIINDIRNFDQLRAFEDLRNSYRAPPLVPGTPPRTAAFLSFGLGPEFNWAERIENAIQQSGRAHLYLQGTGTTNATRFAITHTSILATHAAKTGLAYFFSKVVRVAELASWPANVATGLEAGLFVINEFQELWLRENQLESFPPDVRELRRAQLNMHALLTQSGVARDVWNPYGIDVPAFHRQAIGPNREGYTGAEHARMVVMAPLQNALRANPGLVPALAIAGIGTLNAMENIVRMVSTKAGQYYSLAEEARVERSLRELAREFGAARFQAELRWQTESLAVRLRRLGEFFYGPAAPGNRAYAYQWAAGPSFSNSGSASSGSGEGAGGKGRFFWLYRGRDRNLLLQTLRDLLEILVRDELAASGKKTTQLSSRDSIFPGDVAGLPAAVLTVIAVLKYDLSLVRNRGVLGGFYPMPEAEFNEYLETMWPKLNPSGGGDDAFNTWLSE